MAQNFVMTSSHFFYLHFLMSDFSRLFCISAGTPLFISPTKWWCFAANLRKSSLWIMLMPIRSWTQLGPTVMAQGHGAGVIWSLVSCRVFERVLLGPLILEHLPSSKPLTIGGGSQLAHISNISHMGVWNCETARSEVKCQGIWLAACSPCYGLLDHISEEWDEEEGNPSITIFQTPNSRSVIS